MTEHLTKETFLKKVFDYEKNKEWKFEGDLPCGYINKFSGKRN